MRGAALSLLLAFATTCASAQEANPSFKPTEIKAPFIEQFTDDWQERWTPSEATKKTPVGGETFSYVGQWAVEDALEPVIDGDQGLVAKNKAAHHAISAPFEKPIDFKNDPLVVQYEVKYQKLGVCSGGYLKLLEDGFQTSGKEFSDTTPWVVMFGPDLTCPGTKLHFIFRHQNPKTGEFEEKHHTPAHRPQITKLTNLYTLIIHPDNTFVVNVNGEKQASGSLLEDFVPPVNPPKEIDDPEDQKPSDWVDTKRIPDPDASKPDDWDEDAPYEIVDEEAVKPAGWLDEEPLTIADPDALKPEEWDDEEDGEWVGPTVDNPRCKDAPGCGSWTRPKKANPAYKGKWYAPMIDNPAYIGEWTPRQIPNPAHFEDLDPVKNLRKIGGVGIELWTMTEDILFDNIYVGHSVEDAEAFAAETFKVKQSREAELAEASKEPTEPDWVPPTLKDDPIGFIRNELIQFWNNLRYDPVYALQASPKTAAGVASAFFTLIGMIAALVGLIGAQQKPITKSTKKTDAPTLDDKPKPQTETAPVAPAGEEENEESSTGVKKRKGN